jgi:predicted MPP superfamily phosphohydrolase
MGHYTRGRTHLYVTRGIGFEGLAAPRVRLFCPPEVTLVTLIEETSTDFTDYADSSEDNL